MLQAADLTIRLHPEDDAQTQPLGLTPTERP